MNNMEYTRAIMSKVEPMLKDKGFTWKRLAHSIGVSCATISRYKAGTLTLSAYRLQSLADVLDIPIADLTDGIP